MNCYKQLTHEERYIIRALLKEGFIKNEIARHLGRSPSSISREINRNSGAKGYRPKQANDKATYRRKNSFKSKRFTPEIQLLVDKYIHLDWSPEQISNYLQLEHCMSISTETIYQYVKSDKLKGGSLHTHLRQSSRKRRKRYSGTKDTRGTLKDRVSIDERPAVVDKKSRIGDWEIDTVIGKNHKGALVTIVERKSRYTLLDYIPSRHSENVGKVTETMLKPIKDRVLTITGDNGKEFACHSKISKELGTDFYFAHPYCSWERGLNENTNGLIRQYFPKGSSFDDTTEEKIKFVMERLNNRPRKSLGFKTPKEIFGNFSPPPEEGKGYILH